MRIEQSAPDGGPVVWFVQGDVDLFGSPDLYAVLESEVEAGRDVVLDLSQVSSLDSTGVGVLLGQTQRASHEGVMVAVRRNASGAAMQTIETTGVKDRLHWVSGDDDGFTGVREPRRPQPSGGQTAAQRSSR